MGGSVAATLSGRHTVTLLGSFVKLLITCLKEIFSGVLRSTIVEIIEHQIHILLFLHLEVIVDFGISVHLNFNVSVRLSAQSPWLRKGNSDLLRRLPGR